MKSRILLVEVVTVVVVVVCVIVVLVPKTIPVVVCYQMIMIY